MTKEQIESVLERVRTWPTSRQERETQVYRLSDEERAGIRAALEEVARDEFASDEEVLRSFKPTDEDPL